MFLRLKCVCSLSNQLLLFGEIMWDVRMSIGGGVLVRTPTIARVAHTALSAQHRRCGRSFYSTGSPVSRNLDGIDLVISKRSLVQIDKVAESLREPKILSSIHPTRTGTPDAMA